MFGLNMNDCRIFSINNHAEALAAYERGKPGRKETYGDPRRIPGKEGSKSMDVRITASGSVVFRYHYTDVVTWRKDDTCAVQVYSSASTCRFADRFVPRNMYFEAEMRHLVARDRVYAIVNDFTLNADGPVGLTGLGRFCREVINRRRARQVLANTRYAEYRDWHGLTWPMVKDTLNYRPWIQRGEAVSLLKDDTRWFELLERGINPTTLRHDLYEHARAVEGVNVWDTQIVDTLPRNRAGTGGWYVCEK